MERKEIEAQYTIEHGTIRSPGKFEGEPIYAPHFYEIMLNGGGDATLDDPDNPDIPTEVFTVTWQDREQFPELRGVAHVTLWISEQGFVFTDTWGTGELDERRERLGF